ncbi:MAG: hypothetical protein KAT90_02890 [Gammaproteobacteria bacterium]|nr:hypothetical protein [Gammaproteobacteria bacterium]
MMEQNTPQAQNSEQIPDSELNVAGRVASYFIDNKLTLLIILFAFIAGMYAFLVTPREENPKIVVPAANGNQ